MPASDSPGDAEPSGEPSPPSPVAPSEMSSSEIDQLLARLWRQSLPILEERVSSLEAAAAEALAGKLTAARRVEAANLAHKLAGSLGMFGYGKGTEIARQLEELLDSEPNPDHLGALTAALRSSIPL